MKKLVGVFIISVCLATSLYAQEHLRQLLHSENWRDRDKAIAIISRDLEKFRNDDSVKQEVLRLLVSENERIKYLRKNRLKSTEPGRGEYYINVLDLVIRLDIPDSTEALLDSAGRGNKVEDAIVERLMETGKEDVKVLLFLKENVASPDIFYKGNRSAYLRIINKYLHKEELMNANKKTIVRDIVFNGLLLEDRFAKKYAIQCSTYFPEDTQIIEELRKIAVTDTYTQPKEGLTTFPLREEALKVLEEFQKAKPLEKK